MKPEQLLWQTFRAAMPRNLFMERIENLTSTGTPDAIAIHNGRTFWFELKAPNRPKRPTTPLLGRQGLRKEQIAWQRAAATSGQRGKETTAYTLIRDSAYYVYLIHCSYAAIVNELPADDLLALSCANDWSHVWDIINGRKITT